MRNTPVGASSYGLIYNTSSNEIYYDVTQNVLPSFFAVGSSPDVSLKGFNYKYLQFQSTLLTYNYINYIQDDVRGDYFIVLKPGIYCVIANFISGTLFGPSYPAISKNGWPTYSGPFPGVDLCVSTIGLNQFGTIQWTGPLLQGDIVSVHTNWPINNSDNSSFQVTCLSTFSAPPNILYIRVGGNQVQPLQLNTTYTLEYNTNASSLNINKIEIYGRARNLAVNVSAFSNSKPNPQPFYFYTTPNGEEPADPGVAYNNEYIGNINTYLDNISSVNRLVCFVKYTPTPYDQGVIFFQVSSFNF